MALLGLFVVTLLATSMTSVSAKPSGEDAKGGLFSQFPFFPSPWDFTSDIKNMKPSPGGTFNGVSVSSSSNSHVDKDGKVVQTGESTVVTNQNGVVKEYKS